MILRLWLLVVLTLAGAFAPSRAGARTVETRTWDFFAATANARPESAPQVADSRLGFEGHGYELAPGYSQAAETTPSLVNLNRQLAAQEIAGGHAFTKHAAEFGFKTQAQMATHIESVMTNPTMMRSLSNGRSAFWDNATGSVVIRNPRAVDGGTAFIPKNGVDYFLNLK